MLSWIVSPQQVGTGKPNSEVGVGAECRFASLEARERLDPFGDEEVDERFKKSVIRKKPWEEERAP